MAAKPIRLTPGAREELLEAVEYYDEQALLGDDLFRLVEECLDRIQEAPEAQAPKPEFTDEGVRLALVKRFPYRIVFVEDPDEIRVLAVAHKSRRPGYWRSRLSED